MVKPTVRFPEFKDSWNNYKIEDIFDKVGVAVNLDDTRTYCEIGIRSHGKGIFHKEETTATEIGNKRVFWVESGCFVVNIVFAWERAVAKTTEKENGMIASHRFPMYKPKEDIVDLDYITEYFVTKRGQNVLILASPGGAGRNKTLGQKEFAKSVVKLPSLPEQQKIAEFLLTIDAVIEKQKETISAWEERKKGVMQKLFSQEVRFKADEGNEFPDWEEKKLGEVCAPLTYGMNAAAVKYDGENKYIRITDIDDESHLYKNDGLVSPDGELDDKYLVSENDILLARTGASVGKSYLYDKKDGKLYYAGFLIKAHVKSENSKFIYYQTLTDRYARWVQVTSMRSGQPGINANEYSEFMVYVPCLAEQQKIADSLSSLDEVIEKQKATLAAWEELKKGLLQQMFV